MNDERALSVHEVAERLAIRTHAVLALIRNGELRALVGNDQTHWTAPMAKFVTEDLDGVIGSA